MFCLSQLTVVANRECNVRCVNCALQCRQAPAPDNLSVEQMEGLVADSARTKWRWRSATIIGGEPCLHPDIIPVIELGLQVTKEVWLCTNGSGPRVQQVIKQVSKHFAGAVRNYARWVAADKANNAAEALRLVSCRKLRIRNSRKTSAKQPHHTQVNIAAKDLGLTPELGCRSLGCGFTFTPYGFYAAPACAAVDRVFGYDLGIPSLEDVTLDRLRGQLEKLCPLCGRNPVLEQKPGDEESFSPSWERALAAWKEKEPQLTRVYPRTPEPTPQRPSFWERLTRAKGKV